MAAKQHNVRYEVITQEDPNNGDLIIPIPPVVLKYLGWKEGDDISIDVDENGQLYLRKSDK
jgi:bifunctional DNA-binding transcriptional regulator/antitoxin component of YhaV-PrlF toxin-antitoxin module